MNTRILLLGFALLTTLGAADVSKILLRGASISVAEEKASGAARAVVGDLNISADAIIFDRGANSLKCDGAVTIRVANSVVTTKDCVVELGAGEKRVYFLKDGGSISIQPQERSYFPVSSPDLIGRRADRDKVILEFNSRMSPEPTPTAVAPSSTPGVSK